MLLNIKMISYFTFQQIDLGLISIQVWGFFVSLGFLFSLLISVKEGKKQGVSKENIWDIMIISLIGIIIGSRFFYVFSNFEEFNALSDVFNLYKNGGFSFLGGGIVALILIYIYSKIKKIDIYKLLDVLIIGAIVALTITRVGCFFIYDHVGKITNLPWGRIYIDQSVRHPVALYHIINGIVIICLICYLKKRQLGQGVLALSVVFYFIISRFFLDFTRCMDLKVCDSRHLQLTYSQWILMFITPVSVYLLVIRMKNSKR
ncbi:MAG: prolipoprotein diacylglyceryl transferase [Patescibacteria group bacterium]|nr:prolipoprotein diacylglyceryl transferase [Patescibacteria group bacterium]